MSKYDVAAYVWPAYTGDELRSRMFWPEGIGEWQSVKSAEAKFLGHSWPRQPPLITVNSWNEWTETSYLQPDSLYGYGYLDAVKRVFLDED